MPTRLSRQTRIVTRQKSSHASHSIFPHRRPKMDSAHGL